MLHTKALAYQYTDGPMIAFPDLACPSGSQWLILGRSGSGKSTLLQLLAGLRKPTSGTVQVGQVELTALTSAEQDAYRGKHIGMVYQQSHFLEALTVLENLRIARRMASVSPDEAHYAMLLDRLGIAHKRNRYPRQLSQGEQQRAAIARALVCKPTLILADEPTAALDDYNTREVVRLLQEQATESGATLLIVTHDSRLQAEFDNRVVLDHAIAVE